MTIPPKNPHTDHHYSAESLLMWIPDLSHYIGPRYQALVHAIEDSIRQGKLQPGERLPPQRLLADLLGLHLSTVTRAYKAAISQHLVHATTGNGTFVSYPNGAPQLFALAQPAEIEVDLSVSTTPLPTPDTDLNDTLLAMSQSQDLSSCLAYRHWEEWTPLKRALGAWFAAQHGIQLPSSETLTLCTGAQHALTETLAALVTPSETILCESLTYPGLKTVASQLGIRLAGLAIDHEGIEPEALEKRLKQGGYRLLVLMPTLHNPTTASMSPARREALAELIQRYHITVIEEDVYGPLSQEPHTPLVAYCPTQVIYISGLSKTVAPGLRIGVIIDPGQRLPFGEGHWHSTNWYVNPLLADIAHRWLSDGTASHRLARLKTEMQMRHQIANQYLGEPTSGEIFCPHRWLPLENHKQSQTLNTLLASHGVRVAPDSIFSCSDHRQTPAGIRLALGSATSHNELARAMAILAELRERL